MYLLAKDQEQHLELSRDIAQRFNNTVKRILPPARSTVYRNTKNQITADPSRKMSKSAGEKHYISLFAEETAIRKQIKSAVTDTGETSEVMSEGVANLFEMIKSQWCRQCI